VQGLDEETALGEAVQRGRGVAFVDLSPGAFGGLGQAMDVLADVKVRAERVEQGSVVLVGAQLGTQIALARQRAVVTEVVGQVALLGPHALEVLRLERDAQTPYAVEVAVDLLLDRQLLHQVHRLAEGVVPFPGRGCP
jgi:hypothetical protein